MSTEAKCTCPSGDGSLRWPCPAHPSHMGQLHQHLLDMLGAKDHVDAGRIIGDLHAAALNEQSGNSGQLQDRDVIAGFLLERDEALEPGEANEAERLGSADEILKIIAARQPVRLSASDVHLAAQMLTWGRDEGLTTQQEREIEAHQKKLFEALDSYTAPPAPAAVPVDVVAELIESCEQIRIDSEEFDNGEGLAHGVPYGVWNEFLQKLDAAQQTLATHPQTAAAKDGDA